MLALRTQKVSRRAGVRKSGLAEGLPGGTLDDLFLASVRRTAAPREIIVCEGDHSDSVFEVVEGVVKLYKLTPDGRRQVTGFVYPGQLFGLSLHGACIYTAEAITPVAVVLYPRAKLDRLAARVPGLAQRLLSLATRELIAAQEQMLLLGRKTAVEKIASFLVAQAADAVARGGDGNSLYLPMTRADIGDYLGLTTETVSRVFKPLKEHGIVSLRQQKYVVIHDHAKLIELANGNLHGFEY